MEEGWKVVNYIKTMTSVVGSYTPSHARPVFVAICRRESSAQNTQNGEVLVAAVRTVTCLW